MLEIGRIKYIEQQGKNECGIACLECILSYYNNKVPREYLYTTSMFDGKCVTMLGLKNTFDDLGFECEAVKGDILKEEKLVFPLISHIKIEGAKNNYHYVVIYRISNNYLYIMDPAKGKIKMSKDEFLKLATNYYLFIKPTGNLKNITINKEVNHSIINYLKKNINLIVLIFILIFLSFILDLSMLFKLKIFLNYALIPKVLINLETLSSLFILLLIEKVVIFFILRVYEKKVFFSLQELLRKKTIRQILTLPYLFYKNNSKGKIVTIFNDIEFICSFLTSVIFKISEIILFLIFFYVAFFILYKPVFYLLLGSNLLFLVIVFFEKKKLKGRYTNYQKERALLQNDIYKTSSFPDAIKGYHLERKFEKKFSFNLVNYLTAAYRLEIQKERNSLYFLIVDQLFYHFLFIILSYLLIKDIALKDFTTFLLLESFLKVTIDMEKSLIITLLSLKEVKQAKEEVNELFNIKKELLLPNSMFKLENKVNIAVKNLNYSYGIYEVLKDVNLQISSGSNVFFYGLSGSGKSTFFKIIGRYLTTPSNKVYLNNIDINHYNLDTLRTLITYVSDDFFLEPASLLQNITLGKNKTDKSVSRVLKVTGIDSLALKKEMSIYDEVDCSKKDYSNGEKARIALARALYKNSKVYLFDECLSTLDIKSERKILEKTFKEYKDNTILYISHRLDNKDLFDRVYYFDKGRIYEEV